MLSGRDGVIEQMGVCVEERELSRRSMDGGAGWGGGGRFPFNMEYVT